MTTPTTEIALVELLDEFSFEQDYLPVPASLQTLRARERVILVQDGSCEYVVTLERGRALKLWDPGRHWADQRQEPFQGTLAEAVARAEAWLARYLREPASSITRVIDVAAFPRGPLVRVVARRERARPVAAPAIGGGAGVAEAGPTGLEPARG